MKIEIDEDVYQMLKERAEPFVDTPNDVLRRLLSEASREQRPSQLPRKTKPSMTIQPTSSEFFANRILAHHFKDQVFKRVPPYRYLFESEDSIVYFQNFNQPSDRLWYRLKQKPWDELTHAKKTAIVCLANPAMGFAYIIPVEDIDFEVGRTDWERDDLEVNIDVARSHWLELDWLIDGYKRYFSEQPAKEN